MNPEERAELGLVGSCRRLPDQRWEGSRPRDAWFQKPTTDPIQR
jgi:predicted aminopeptidase